MAKRIKNWFKKIKVKRSTILALVFFVLAFILIRRLFNLQIISGEEYRNNFTLQTTRERTLKSTRGNIMDRNGNVLASNQLSYSITLEDNGTYDTNRERALSLNSEAYKICKLLEAHGDSISNDFHIVIDEDGTYQFNVSGVSLSRFRADVYGHALIDDLTPEESEATAEEMMAALISEKRFAVVRTDKPYTEEELAGHGLPAELTKAEILQICNIRYELSTTSYQKYVPVTIATNVSNESVAALTENKDNLTGLAVVEDTIRVYTDSEYFAPLIGYTGKASAEELATLQEEKDGYSSGSVVGKSGIEQVMETTLQGSNGKEKVSVDNLGKVLAIDDTSRIEPLAGSDVYLSIDKELQIATYQVLEQRIAGIIVSVLTDTKTFDKTNLKDSSEIIIPIYDVYNALINNSVIDISHFTAEDASASEQALQTAYEAKQSEIFGAVSSELTGTNPSAYRDLSKEMQEYMSYIVNELLMQKTGILSETAIDKTDDVYLAWTEQESISLQEYLTYAASQNWINISSISSDDTYLDSNEVYDSLAQYINDYLATDTSFGKLLYKYLLQEDRISGNQICNILYDQGILPKDDSDYANFAAGTMSSFDLLKEKINKIEITPAQLALDPCSGSAVVTDPNTGEVLACVTYPGYDNNRLANDMDVAYYKKLSSDLSEPFYNKATQQRIAPGSTFKLVTTAAGLTERVIDENALINCNGAFNLTETELKCWNRDGHGDISVVNAIGESCNVFFSNVAFRLGTDENGDWSDSLALRKLQTYSNMFDLDKNSGIEISEAAPQVSNINAIQSAIGQGNHLYTTSELARYVSTLANKGTSYNISLIDKVADASGNVIEDYTADISSNVSLTDNVWNVIHNGMEKVIEGKPEFSDIDLKVAGKTGTAQQSKTRPDHSVFIAYAPADNPQISMAVRIAFGYSSTNAMLVGKDILKYYFDLEDEANILTGEANSENVTSVQSD